MAQLSLNCNNFNCLQPPLSLKNTTLNNSNKFLLNTNNYHPFRNYFSSSNKKWHYLQVVNGLQEDSGKDTHQDDEVYSLGVRAALSFLSFYKREISPVLPRSCRFVPTCSEYSTIAYKRYGFAKGTVLTAWRLCRCNPLGGSGFDPPRWFDEPSPPEK